MDKDHIHFMKKAFDEANFAFFKNEVPVGCVIVNDNEIISRSSNMVELLNDSTAHAELIAITSAQNSLNSKNLDISVRLPNEIREIELGLRKIISENLLRGKIDLFVTIEDCSNNQSKSINSTVVNDYELKIPQYKQSLIPVTISHIIIYPS